MLQPAFKVMVPVRAIPTVTVCINRCVAFQREQRPAMLEQRSTGFVFQKPHVVPLAVQVICSILLTVKASRCRDFQFVQLISIQTFKSCAVLVDLSRTDSILAFLLPTFQVPGRWPTSWRALSSTRSLRSEVGVVKLQVLPSCPLATEIARLQFSLQGTTSTPALK